MNARNAWSRQSCDQFCVIGLISELGEAVTVGLSCSSGGVQGNTPNHHPKGPKGRPRGQRVGTSCKGTIRSLFVSQDSREKTSVAVKLAFEVQTILRTW